MLWLIAEGYIRIVVIMADKLSRFARRGERLDQDHSVDWLMRCNTVTITGFLFTFSSAFSPAFAIPFSPPFLLSFPWPIGRPTLARRRISSFALFSSGILESSLYIRRLHLVTRNYPHARSWTCRFMTSRFVIRVSISVTKKPLMLRTCGERNISHMTDLLYWFVLSLRTQNQTDSNYAMLYFSHFRESVVTFELVIISRKLKHFYKKIQSF